MQLGARSRNKLRRLLQLYGTGLVKRWMWNLEFSRGWWKSLEHTPGDCVYPLVEKHANSGSILDLGCGSGNTGNELAVKSYHDYTGVDISDVAIRKAIMKTNECGRAHKNRYLQADISRYVPSQRFDVILLRDSIYYIPAGKIALLLRRYARFLKKEGVFVVRLAGENRHAWLLGIIEEDFTFLENRGFDQPPARVFVFGPKTSLL